MMAVRSAIVATLLMAGTSHGMVATPAAVVGGSSSALASPVVRLPRAVTVPIDVDGEMCNLQVAEGADPAVLTLCLLSGRY